VDREVLVQLVVGEVRVARADQAGEQDRHHVEPRHLARHEGARLREAAVHDERGERRHHHHVQGVEAGDAEQGAREKRARADRQHEDEQHRAEAEVVHHRAGGDDRQADPERLDLADDEREAHEDADQRERGDAQYPADALLRAFAQG
jgi:hypothetical protein